MKKFIRFHPKDLLGKCFQKQGLFKDEKKSENMVGSNIEIFLRMQKHKAEDMVMNDIKVFLKMENKVLLSIGKNAIKYGR